MSHTATAKCAMKCSLDVLRRVIEQKFPEWAKHIMSSDASNLPYHNFNGQVESKDNALVIPGLAHARQSGGQAAPGLGYCDIGFHLVEGTVEDGVWEAQLDGDELRYGKHKNIMETINANIADAKARQFIDANVVPGLAILGREETEGKIKFKVGGNIDPEEVENVARRRQLI